MSRDELPFDAHDTMETVPAELHDLYIKVVTSSLAKKLAPQYDKPWTPALETKHQEAIASLVAAARNRNLESFKVISVKPDGRRLEFDMSVDKIAKDRVLQ